MAERWIDLHTGAYAEATLQARWGRAWLPNDQWVETAHEGAPFLTLNDDALTFTEGGLYVVRAEFPAWFLFQTPSDAEPGLAQFSKFIDVTDPGWGGSGT